MNRKELRKTLEKMGILPSVYCFDGTRDNDVFTVEGKGDTWAVFYYERGEKSVVKLCDSEDEACRVLLEELRKDSSNYAGGSTVYLD